MGTKTLSAEELFEENLKLRQERLNLVNLISITQDQISILLNPKSSNLEIPANAKNYSSEFYEFAKVLLEEHKEAIKIDIDLIDSESMLFSHFDEIDKLDYCEALQQLIEKKLNTYTHILLSIRAAKLAKH